MIAHKSVITIATGKKIYTDMAINLARSFMIWNDYTAIKFYIITDLVFELPIDLEKKIEILIIEKNKYGEGFSSKLSLDLMAQTEKVLFIDADCLITRSLEEVFQKFDGHHVSVVGGYVSEGEWFGDIAKICLQFNLEKLPKFNGGLYYLEPGAKTSSIYETARSLEPQYDEIGLTRLRGRPNDELLMAISIAVHGESPIFDDGSIMSDPQACPGRMQVDIFKGKAYLENPPIPNPKHQSWYPFEVVSPTIVHFLGYHTGKRIYRTEALKMKLVLLDGYSVFIASLIVKVLYDFPLRFENTFINFFRPIYRFLFGYRKIKPSERV